MKKFIFVTMAFTMLLTLTTACATVRGSGNVITEEREVQNFTSVVISGPGQLILSQGDDVSLRIEAEDNIIPLIETTVSDDTLFIGGDEAKTAVLNTPIKLYLTMKDITSLTSSDLSQIHATNIEVDQLQIMSGMFGKIIIDDLIANKISIQLTDDSNVELSGEVQEQEIDVAGHADYRGAELNSQTATVNIGDTGTATVWVETHLSGIVNGNGDVLYYGAPETALEVSDSGKAKNKEK